MREKEVPTSTMSEERKKEGGKGELDDERKGSEKGGKVEAQQLFLW